MCLAVPGQIVSIIPNDHFKSALVDFNGVQKEICIEWVPDAETGDFVVVHAGFALDIVDPVEAGKTLKLIEDLIHTPE